MSKTKAELTPIPSEGIKLVGFLLTNHFRKLMYVNLIYIGFCLPIITIPPASAALTRVMVKLVRDGNVFMWDEFIQEFKTDFFKSIWMVLLVCSLLGFSMTITFLLTGSFITSTGTEGFAWINIIALVFIYLVLCYAMAALSIVQLRTSEIIRSAFILTVIEPKCTLKLLLLPGLLRVLLLLLFPISLVLMPFGLFSIISLWENTLVYPKIQKHMIK